MITSSMKTDYSLFLHVAKDGSIWWRLEDAIKLGAGYFPIRDDERNLFTILQAKNNLICANARSLLSEFSQDHYTEAHPRFVVRNETPENGHCVHHRYVEATEFLKWLSKYIAQTQSTILFPNDLACAVRRAIRLSAAAMSPATQIKHKEDRRSEGRYTLEEAATQIKQETGEPADEMLEKLMQAVSNDELPVYEPNKKARYKSKTVQGVYEEVYWNDLNTWLGSNEPRLGYIFQDPDTLVADKQENFRGLTKQQVMSAFEGTHFDFDHWGRNLASPPDWLKDCRVSKGSRSTRTSALWNPVQIAVALYDKQISIKKLDAIFVWLKDWIDEWQEASVLFRD